ncbi:hypothetical protein Tco_0466121 [Tanacetum coccineum]
MLSSSECRFDGHYDQIALISSRGFQNQFPYPPQTELPDLIQSRTHATVHDGQLLLLSPVQRKAQVIMAHYRILEAKKLTVFNAKPRKNGNHLRESGNHVRKPVLMQALVEAMEAILIDLQVPKRFSGSTNCSMGKKPNLQYFRVFGSLCYPTNDYDDVGKLKAKADIVRTSRCTSKDPEPPIVSLYKETCRRFVSMVDEMRLFRLPPVVLITPEEIIEFERLDVWILCTLSNNILAPPFRQMDFPQHAHVGGIWKTLGRRSDSSLLTQASMNMVIFQYGRENQHSSTAELNEVVYVKSTKDLDLLDTKMEPLKWVLVSKDSAFVLKAYADAALCRIVMNKEKYFWSAQFLDICASSAVSNPLDAISTTADYDSAFQLNSTFTDEWLRTHTTPCWSKQMSPEDSEGELQDESVSE